MLIKQSGLVVGIDGFSIPEFNVHVRHNLYAVVYHRNHLGIMSAAPLVKNNEIYTYDFTTGIEKAYDNGQKYLGGNFYGMRGGDGEPNGSVNDTDKNVVWKYDAGMKGYKAGDFDLNNHVANRDKNDIWRLNKGYSVQVPQ